MKAHYSILIIGIALLASGCNRKEEPKKPTVVTPAGTTFEAKDVFHQNRYYTDALGLSPREPDGVLEFTFNTDPSAVHYKYPAQGFENPTPNLHATTGTSGSDHIDFHLEFPMTVGQSLPDVILDIQTIVMSGGVQFNLTLDPDFPFTEAYVEQAVITLPSWIEEEYSPVLDNHRMDWPFSKTIRPGEVNSYSFYCSNSYAPETGDGIRETDHYLVLDATISIDGTLSVDENKRKNPKEASTPWSATFLSHLNAETCRVWRITGRLDLSKGLEDRTLTFAELPAFLNDSETVFDLDDIYGELTVQNDMPIPISVSGDILGDDRRYPFTLSRIQKTEYGDRYHGLLSEKGGRVEKSMGALYHDIPIPGLSGLIDSDPVSFAVKDVRITNDTDTPYTFYFDEYNTVTLQASVSSPLLIGKDFQARHFADLFLLRGPELIDKVSGTCTIENTLPFDYEIRPVFYRADVKLPISADPVKIPAGSRESPVIQTYSFDWAIHSEITTILFELKGRTGSNRQGEALYQDQHVTVKDITLEVLPGSTN